MTSPAYSQDAFEFLRGMLREWGLDELGNDVQQMLLEGVSKDIVPLRLRETGAYKTRFAGNIARQKAGLPPLSEADYLNTETALKKVVSRYAGMSAGDSAFGNPDNLSKWIAADVSPQELNDRFSAYQRQYVQQPQWVKDAWSGHGLTPWDAMVAIMDPKVSEQQLTKKLNTFALTSEAMQSYGAERFDWQDINRYQDYADKGLSSQDVRDGTSQVAAREQRESFLAGLAGTQLDRATQEKDAVLKDAGAARQRADVLGKERDRFSQNYLGGQNALRQNSQGSY